MSAEVVTLQTRREECRASVIERLEEALAAARAGEMVSVAIAAVAPDGRTSTSFSDAEVVSPLLGAVAFLQFKMIKRAMEEG